MSSRFSILALASATGCRPIALFLKSSGGLSSGKHGGKKNKAEPALEALDVALHHRGLVCGMPVHDQEDRPVRAVNDPIEEFDEHTGGSAALVVMNRNSPCRLTAEIRSGPKRAPVMLPTGVLSGNPDG
jgi:hypothetical protein